MTIQSIEQVLDGAIALLMYGSGTWLSYSLVTFVVTRSKDSINRRAITQTKVQLALPQANSSVVEPDLKESFEESDSEGLISIEVTPVDRQIPMLPPAPVVQPIPVTPLIVCEPVNWRKWKVGELRQASITQVCGVRTTPIGSSRKLKKADLIAQYEQNLKRMTHERPARPMQSEKIA